MLNLAATQRLQLGRCQRRHLLAAERCDLGRFQRGNFGRRKCAELVGAQPLLYLFGRQSADLGRGQCGDLIVAEAGVDLRGAQRGDAGCGQCRHLICVQRSQLGRRQGRNLHRAQTGKLGCAVAVQRARARGRQASQLAGCHPVDLGVRRHE